MSCKLWVTVVSCDFKKIHLRVASSFSRVANLFCELEIKLQVAIWIKSNPWIKFQGNKFSWTVWKD